MQLWQWLAANQRVMAAKWQLALAISRRQYHAGSMYQLAKSQLAWRRRRISQRRHIMAMALAAALGGISRIYWQLLEMK